MLNKFIDKHDKMLDNTFVRANLQTVLDTRDVSESNLIDHKRLLLELIGFINREEDDRYLMEIEKRNLEKDVREMFYGWDLIKANLDFRERLRRVNADKIREHFMLQDEIRNMMKKDDLAVLINLERIRTAMSGLEGI